MFRHREQAHSYKGSVLGQGSAITLQMLADFCGRDFLQLAQQVVIQLAHPMLAAQLIRQMRHQVRRHLRIGHGPVSLAGVRQARERGERAELVIRRRRHQPPRQQQRTGEVLQARAFDPAQFEIPELLVERGVVRQQRRAADEFVDLFHHPLGRRRGAQHGVADAGQLLDERGDAHAGVHQALVTLDNAAVFQHDHGNFRSAAAAVRRQTGGFKVDDCNAFQTGVYSVQINGSAQFFNSSAPSIGT